uniref:Uncharacterized protein n=1 Tax=Timema poppense TaxID=170557 RepID=A0A7R9DUF6_TIMPO|nr:unnamed protein product [Timema poppensis]
MEDGDGEDGQHITIMRRTLSLLLLPLFCCTNIFCSRMNAYLLETKWELRSTVECCDNISNQNNIDRVTCVCVQDKTQVQSGQITSTVRPIDRKRQECVRFKEELSSQAIYIRRFRHDEMLVSNRSEKQTPTLSLRNVNRVHDVHGTEKRVL